MAIHIIHDRYAVDIHFPTCGPLPVDVRDAVPVLFVPRPEQAETFLILLSLPLEVPETTSDMCSQNLNVQISHFVHVVNIATVKKIISSTNWLHLECD